MGGRRGGALCAAAAGRANLIRASISEKYDFSAKIAAQMRLPVMSQSNCVVFCRCKSDRRSPKSYFSEILAVIRFVKTCTILGFRGSEVSPLFLPVITLERVISLYGLISWYKSPRHFGTSNPKDMTSLPGFAPQGYLTYKETPPP